MAKRTTAIGNASPVGMIPGSDGPPGPGELVQPLGRARDCKPRRIVGQKTTSPPMTPMPNAYPMSSQTDTVFWFVFRAYTEATIAVMKRTATSACQTTWSCSPEGANGTAPEPPPGNGNAGGRDSSARSRFAIANAREPRRTTDAKRRRGGTPRARLRAATGLAGRMGGGVVMAFPAATPESPLRCADPRAALGPPRFVEEGAP